MAMSDSEAAFFSLIRDYVDRVEGSLIPRWQALAVPVTEHLVRDVYAALLSRQVNLATEVARNPGIWNPHSAPLFLRAMADVVITTSWISRAPEERSRRFVLYGLGQLKLHLDHRAVQLEADGLDPEEDPVIQMETAWMNTQRFTFLTDVDLGSFSGISVRKMAEEADCVDFYNYVYTPFSAAAHSSWHHIARFNLDACAEPLHRPHSLPGLFEYGVDVDYLYRAAKYVDKAFRILERATEVSHPEESAFDWLERSLGEFSEIMESEGDSTSA